MSDLDIHALSEWLEQNVEASMAATDLTKFPGGQSNPTYALHCSDRAFVLRRKPFGVLLPSAHAIEREYRLISALHPTGFPVPRPIILCEDPDVIGAPFYLMEMVEGQTFWDGTLPDVPAGERSAIYEKMIDTLATLHSIDYEELGLSDFGKPGNFFTRQVGRWTKQYRIAQTDEIPEIEKLIDWLPATVPTQTRSSIIHGDYRIDNLIYDKSGMKVLAVIDWELATIGDPLADFAYLAMNWILPVDGRSGLAGLDLDQYGLPTLEKIVTRYKAATGMDHLPDLHWYFAYNLFRLAGILQGVKKRAASGNASSADAEEMAAKIGPLAAAAWEQARLAGAPA